MKTRKFFAVLTVFCIAALMAAPVFAQEGEAPAEVSPDMAKMIEALTKYGTPGPMHEMMAKWDGEWTAVSTSYWDPTKPPEKSTGKATNWMFMDGRFQMQKYEGEWSGQKYEGLGIMGYDIYHEEFVSVWMDNMSTMLMLMTGNFNEDMTELVMEGTMDDFLTGEKDKLYRTITKIVSDDEHLFEMWEPGLDGEWFKSFDMVYTRVKAEEPEKEE